VGGESPAPRRWTKLAAGGVVLAALPWSTATAALWFGQERLLFKPVPLSADTALSREPDVTERFVDVPGARLSVLELRRPDPEGVVFFLHGNSANLREWFIDRSLYRRANLDLVMMDYRGFGKSSGRSRSSRSWSHPTPACACQQRASGFDPGRQMALPPGANLLDHVSQEALNPGLESKPRLAA
jgi:pimeloyl-ACP methyl ester carboxylesterase